jgi:hypothetical protein
MTTTTSAAPATMTENAPLAIDAFVADRQAFWTSFTSFTTYVAGALIVLLILMAIFLV